MLLILNTSQQQRFASASLVTYVKGLPLESTADSYGRADLVTYLLDHAKSSLGSNTIVIPVLQTFNLLLEADALEDLADHEGGLKT